MSRVGDWIARLRDRRASPRPAPHPAGADAVGRVFYGVNYVTLRL